MGIRNKVIINTEPHNYELHYLPVRSVEKSKSVQSEYEPPILER